MTMNAFHPDYAKTHMSGILKTIRAESKQSAAGQLVSNYIEDVRKQKPMHGTLSGISKKEPTTKPLEFMYYSRAGTKNTTVKKKGKP